MPLVVELHPNIKELQEDVLWCLIPLDESIRAKQHHVACNSTALEYMARPVQYAMLFEQCIAMQYPPPTLQRHDSHAPADIRLSQPLQVLTVYSVLPRHQYTA